MSEPLEPLGMGPLEPDRMRAAGAAPSANGTAAECDDSNMGATGIPVPATAPTCGPQATSSQGSKYRVWLDQCRRCLRHVDACICG